MLLTERLKLRELDEGDAAFIFTLLNDPAFLEFIGDRNEVQALEYIHRIREGKRKNGFSLWAVTLLKDGTAAGVCGLVRRDSLPHVDIGFAFLPQLAICSPNNVGSRALLEQVGFQFERMTVLQGQTEATCVYQLSLFLPLPSGENRGEGLTSQSLRAAISPCSQLTVRR